MCRNYENYKLITEYNGLINLISETLKRSVRELFWNIDSDIVDWGEFGFPERYADEFFNNFNYKPISIGTNIFGLENYDLYIFNDNSDVECIFFFRGKWDFGYVTKENFENIFSLNRKGVYQEKKFDKIEKLFSETLDSESWEIIQNSFLYENLDLIKEIMNLRNDSIHYVFSDIFNLNYYYDLEIFHWIEKQKDVEELLKRFLNNMKEYIYDTEEEFLWNESDDFLLFEKIIINTIEIYKKIEFLN